MKDSQPPAVIPAATAVTPAPDLASADQPQVSDTGPTILWPRPCPSWCQEHEDHPATDREGPAAYHGRVIDTWPSDLGDQGARWPIVIEVWNYTYPDMSVRDTNREPGAHLRIDGGQFVHPDDAERIAKAILEGVRLIREDEAR